MLFSGIAVVLSLAISTLAAPVSKAQKRVDTLTFRTYNDFQISDGVAGNALEEVNEAFPLGSSDPATVSSNDLAILAAARETSENAEQTFTNAVAAASGTQATALQVGKIKNKVLKLRTFEILVTAQIAQGATDKAAELTDIQTKLAANVKTDQASAGQASQSISFTADVQP
ncbi:hypothetical protein BJ170DRAFT_362400 [Xylariales sp. AK1849]|nr:hypothetical protein BJ170DRAFT_362400 [Xylariales sp. AK1849]